MLKEAKVVVVVVGGAGVTICELVPQRSDQLSERCHQKRCLSTEESDAVTQMPFFYDYKNVSLFTAHSHTNISLHNKKRKVQ